MSKRLAKLSLLAGVVAAIGSASPASAACVGTAQTVGICASLTKTTIYSDCVYLGEPPCTPVNVPGYDVDCWGWIGDDGVIMCS